jgi:hypothetical protein
MPTPEHPFRVTLTDGRGRTGFVDCADEAGVARQFAWFEALGHGFGNKSALIPDGDFTLTVGVSRPPPKPPVNLADVVFTKDWPANLWRHEARPEPTGIRRLLARLRAAFRCLMVGQA